MANADVHPLHRLAAIGCFAAALATYLAALSPGAAPGESTAYLAQHLGLAEFPPMSHIVWGWLVQVLDMAGVRPPSYLPNLLSAVCGAGIVALVYLLVSRLAFNLEFEIDAARIRLLAGVAGAFCAMVSAPIWLVSTRAHPYALDLLLLLAALFFLSQYKASGRPLDLYAFGITYAVAAAEFDTCLLLTPPLALYVLWLMKVNGRLRPRPLLALASCGLITLAFYAVAAWHYSLTPAASWR
jgi:hypothetical protein